MGWDLCQWCTWHFWGFWYGHWSVGLCWRRHMGRMVRLFYQLYVMRGVWLAWLLCIIYSTIVHAAEWGAWPEQAVSVFYYFILVIYSFMCIPFGYHFWLLVKWWSGEYDLRWGEGTNMVDLMLLMKYQYIQGFINPWDHKKDRSTNWGFQHRISEGTPTV